jgi:hypothetical protein
MILTDENLSPKNNNDLVWNRRKKQLDKQRKNRKTTEIEEDSRCENNCCQ